MINGDKLFGNQSGFSQISQLECAQIGLKYLRLITLNQENLDKSVSIVSSKNLVVQYGFEVFQIKSSSNAQEKVSFS
ncbi:hypothetical protein GW891_01485 [bacterium]|nr:hypothetical protein [bacterium]